MSVSAPPSQGTHEVTNQPPPLEGRNLFEDNLPLVEALEREGGGWALIVGAPHVSIPPLLAHLEREHVPLASLTTHQATLEDVFVSLTGRTLREHGD